MALKKDERLLIMLMITLLAFQTYHGSKVSAAEEFPGHSYIIFQEDFEDGDAEDWSMNIPDEAPPGSGWTIELDDGNYVLSGRGQTWAEAGDFSWTNYTLEVKVKMLSPPFGGHISFRFRAPLRYFVQFWSNDMVITKEYMGTFTEVVHSSVLLNPNTWYDFKIDVVGNSMWVYVDDVLKLEHVDEDDPILSGRIGLESSPDSQIYFDDVKVSTTYRLYVEHLIQEAEDEIYKAKQIDAETIEAEQRLSDAQTAFSDGDLASTESLALEAFNLAKSAFVGAVSVDKLLKYSAEYDQHIIEVSGTIRDIRYEEGLYSFAIDDGSGVISATFNRTLGEIRSEDEVEVKGVFSALNRTITAESVEKKESTMQELYTLLIFKDDFEDGDFSDWRTDVDPRIEGSRWKVEKEGDNQVLSCEGSSWGWAGDTEWTDYTIELKLKLVKGGCGISFRISHKPEGAEHYTLSFSRYGLSLVKTELYLKEARTTEHKRVSIDLNPDRWYDVQIFCIENNIKAYLDGVLKVEYSDEDNPFLTGAIDLGVFPHNGDKPSHALFDDIKVSRIATTGDINDLITYTQSEIDKAREINADVSSAELKLEQVKQALAQENYQIVQYMVDEAVWLAKRSSVGQIAIKDLRAMATLCSGHAAVITGAVKDLQSQYGTGYNFNLDDGTGGLTVTYQGVLTDIEDGYEVKVTGIFDASNEIVAASVIEKISGPLAPIPVGPFGLTWDIELITTLITIGGTAVGVIGWFVRHESMEKRRKVLFKKLLDEVDAIYSRFKMNAVQCEAELYKLKDEVLDEFKEGTIDEDKHNILEQRIEKYLKEVREQIEAQKSQ